MTKQIRFSNRRGRTLLALGLGLVSCLAACEESGSTSSTSGGASLIDQPQSSLGKSAAAGRNLADQVRSRDAATSAAAGRLGESDSVEVAGIGFTIPDGWRSAEPANAMRAAELHVGDCLTTFSVAGGGVEANIDRWAAQVVDPAGGRSRPAITSRTINTLPVTLVEISGTYMDGMPGSGSATPRSGWVVLGAIVETGRGGNIFIKLVGPASDASQHFDAWIALIESAHRI
jgi:hypothetical protein